MRTKSVVVRIGVPLALLALICAAAYAVAAYLNPLRRPDYLVEKWLAELTPYATPKAEVRAFLEARGWIVRSTEHPQGGGSLFVEEIGSYRGVACTVQVSAVWHFDWDNGLRTIHVWKKSWPDFVFDFE
jgi:hypothetical protein